MWIDSVLTATDEAECPKQFLRWACLTVLGAAVKKNVYLNKGGVYRLYPNTYTLIVADSGSRKSFAAFAANKLLKEVVGRRIISGRRSIQQIIQELGKPLAGQADASGCLISGEFTDLISEDRQAMTLLTELYDASYQDIWEYKTKHAGVDSLHDVCLSMFGATTKEHFDDYFSAKDISGGFLARTIVVHATGLDKLNSLVDDTGVNIDWKALSQYLQDIAKLTGPMHLLPNAKKDYHDWYMEFFKPENIQRIGDKTGFIMRSHDHLLKVAMLLSLSRGMSLEITLEDIEQAREIVFTSNTTVRRFLAGGGTGTLSHVSKTLMAELMKANGYTVDKSQLLSKYYGDFDLFDLNKVIETMTEADIIDVVRHGKSTLIKAKQHVVDKYIQFKGKI